MLGVDLLFWLIIVGVVTVAWSLLTSRHVDEVLIRQERPQDITPLMRYSSKEIGRRNRDR